MNLVINARDAMPQGGRLTIEACNVEMDDTYKGEHQVVIPGRYVVLGVQDTGCGMDRDTQSRIFEPFYTTKELGKGTGLGLATVYGIVKQSGGYIWVYSELNQGTLFKVYLPRVDESVQPAKKEPEAVVLESCKTILLAEDSVSLREMAREYLASLGYVVLEAASGREALQERMKRRPSEPPRPASSTTPRWSASSKPATASSCRCANTATPSPRPCSPSEARFGPTRPRR